MQGTRLSAAIFILLVACGTGIALAAENPVDSSLSASPAPSRGVELPDKRTAISDTYRLPSGELKTQIYTSPINFRDGQGDWKPIDEGLEYEGASLTNGANSFDLTLPAKMDSGAVRLSEAGQWVSYKLLGEETGPAEVQDNTASYKAPSSGATFDLSSFASGVKETIELTDSSQPTAFRYALDASAGLTPTLTPDGSIAFDDSSGDLFVALPAPVVFEAGNTEQASPAAAAYELREQAPGDWVLILALDREWLSSPDRAWPIVVDPTLTTGASLDCVIASQPSPEGWTGCGKNGQPILAATVFPEKNQIDRSFIKFDVGSIPDTAYVSGAALKLNSPEAVENTPGVQLRRATKGWNENLNWKYYYKAFSGLVKYSWTSPGGDYTSEGAEVLTSERGSQAGSWIFESSGFTELVQGWVIGFLTDPTRHIPNDGIMLKNVDESTGCGECKTRLMRFDSSADPDVQNRPKLEVTYYNKAPSTSQVTSPVAGTVTGRRLKLKAGWSKETAGVTGVTFQYRGPGDAVEGKMTKGAFHTIPAELVQDANGDPVTWPTAVSGVYSTEPIYFDAAHADATLEHSGGDIEIRALFEGEGKAGGYSAPVKATVKRYLGGPHDGSTEIGPANVDLLTGNLSLSFTDVSIPVFESDLEFSRSWGSGESGKTSLLGPGWTLSAPVEAAGGSEWQKAQEFIPDAEEKEWEIPGYVILTDSEGYEYAFEMDAMGS